MRAARYFLALNPSENALSVNPLCCDGAYDTIKNESLHAGRSQPSVCVCVHLCVCRVCSMSCRRRGSSDGRRVNGLTAHARLSSESSTLRRLLRRGTVSVEQQQKDCKGGEDLHWVGNALEHRQGVVVLPRRDSALQESSVSSNSWLCIGKKQNIVPYSTLGLPRQLRAKHTKCSCPVMSPRCCCSSA